MSINKSNPVVIRPASLQELSLVAELERQVFTSAVYPEFFFRQAHDLWPDYLILAWKGEQLLGYLLAAPGQQGSKSIGIMSLAVSQQSRGLGVGQALLQYLLQHCPAQTEQLWLTVAPDNQSALHLYKKSGFIQHQYHEDYYGKDEPRWLLVKQLMTVNRDKKD
ncbi:MAG: GNAT family N-acetyltransferase [Gammaproteobacteria bacterium]|jgi:[ribosomal protein S18]-alanine N-acetyltransferase|nr:GNAT family N-acetyltransferase [Gammaproteobacteria bacterium]MBU2277497.1 GNAT family N-acetyltransferase [Gammaproteobacteria bacterium]MBU2426367.1 GNAT family N-acetyltransferase [Gammaproteobacteria bacterium]